MLILRRFAAIAAIMLPVALGGCFTSEHPLFDEKDAVPAFGDGGHYVAYENTENGYKPDEKIELRRTGAGYDYVDEQGHVSPVTFYPLGGDLFAVQAKSAGNAYLYARVRITGGAGFVQVPDCGKQDAQMDKLMALGVEKRQFECSVDAVKDIRAVFSVAEFGEPTGKLVAE